MKRESNSLVSEAVSEMRNMGIDNWMSRVRQVEKLLNMSIKPNLKTSESVGKYLKQKLQSYFDIFWKYQISKKMELITTN